MSSAKKLPTQSSVEKDEKSRHLTFLDQEPPIKLVDDYNPLTSLALRKLDQETTSQASKVLQILESVEEDL